MRAKLRAVLLAVVVLVLGFGITSLPPTAEAAPPPMVVDSLAVPTGAQAGQAIRATARVHSTAGNVAVQAVTVAVRAAGQAYDFPGAVAATIPPSGYTFTSGARAFAPGTYTAFVAVRVNNVWYNLSPQRTFTVSQAAPPTVVLETLTVPSSPVAGASVTASARMRASSGTINAQAVTIAVRKAGEAFDFPGAVAATIPTSGYTFTSQPRTFGPGTYEAFAAVQVGGRWTNLAPSRAFTVGPNPAGCPVPGTTTANPVTFCQDFNGNPGGDANAGLRNAAGQVWRAWDVDRCWQNRPSCDGVTSQYRDDHARQDGNNLVLTADRNMTAGARCPTDADPNRLCNSASARLTMLNWDNGGAPRWKQRGGHFEVRAQMPTGRGLWPAFWTHGDPTVAGAWPRTGEIDVFENLGHEPDRVHQVVHGGPGDYRTDVRDNGAATVATVPGGVTGWHTYAIDWKSGVNGYITWSIDGRPTRTLTAAAANALQPGLWNILDQPQALILDLKVGGSWSGAVPAGPLFKTMRVDYIRVLQQPLV